MKNNEAMTNAERQANYRDRLNESEGTRFSVVLSGIATTQLNMITKTEKITKKAAIEAALALYFHAPDQN